ncbi:hypothetical protein [Flavobacterium koreense]
MKPSKNALAGYTYQKSITALLLAKMDAEREIAKIESEADVENNFEDCTLIYKNLEVYCQMKDFDDVKLNDLKIETNCVYIKNKKHKLSEFENILFFKSIDVSNNSEILGIPAFKTEKLYIISLSREESNHLVYNLYLSNPKRESIIHHFFEQKLDKREFIIKREDLPSIDIYNIQLSESTIDVARKILKVENILFIEGKPGVGKSHFVNSLTKKQIHHLVYRFWVSNQDKDFNDRLIFKNFISNITKELFQDFKPRTEKEIIQKIFNDNRLVVIDGLDHVENYKTEELEKFISFIDILKKKCKIIVLSRPLKKQIKWKKQILNNWNKKQTKKVLNELYHITDYKTNEEIFNKTNGYPILVRFIAEHYKKYKILPDLNNLSNIDDYYNQIIKSVELKRALSLFISSRSFFMKSEIELFLGKELSGYVNDLVRISPYLFDIKLNRISLFHDSFNTYLRKQEIDNSICKVNEVVYNSIMNEEKRFLSRFSFFYLNRDMKLEIIKKYSNINIFKNLIKNCIDFEAIRAFYIQIRESLNELEPFELNVNQYYDLSLITNIIYRDQVSTFNHFFYTYVKCLKFNGFDVEDITSSEYLFAMFYYLENEDITLLYNLTSDNNYSTDYFYKTLKNDIYEENNYIIKQQKPLEYTKHINDFINRNVQYNSHEFISDILVNLYIHKTSIKELFNFQNAIIEYVDVNENRGIELLSNLLIDYNINNPFPRFILNNSKKTILALGKGKNPNDYQLLNLKDYINKNKNIGSFDMLPKILNYMRLSLFEKRKIDLSSIGLFWTMYYERKDYTVINICEALKVFEEKKLISEEDSCKLIINTQKKSEKGIRNLFTDYINIHSPKTIFDVINKLDIYEIEVSWFHLTIEHINKMPENIFNFALNQTIKQSSYSGKVGFREIENIFKTNKWQKVIEKLVFFRLSISISKTHKLLKKLKQEHPNLVVEYEERNESKYRSNSIKRYNQGILTSKDINFIKKKNINIKEISGFTDGNYSAFSDLEIYKIYSKDEIKSNIQNILYYSILGKIKSINSFGSLFYLVGNIPKFIFEYEIETDIEKLHKSFNCFLELSLLDDFEQNSKNYSKF